MHDSFYNSWLGKHPRRTGEAYFNQYIEAKFISDNPIPSDFHDLHELLAWYAPLRAAEQDVPGVWCKAGGVFPTGPPQKRD